MHALELELVFGQSRVCDHVDKNKSCKEDASIMSHVPSLAMQLELPWSDLLVDRQQEKSRQLSICSSEHINNC